MKAFFFFFLVFFASKTFAVESKTEISYGRALDASSGELLYSEKHTTVFKKGVISSLHTEYYNLKKDKFADLKSNFKIHPYLPDYVFKDSRFGREDGAVNSEDGKTVEVFAQKKTGASKKTTTFPFKEMLITGQGLHSYMNTNIKKLVKSDASVEIDFLIPMNQKTYAFEIKKMEVKDGKAIFKVKIKSWFLSMFAPYLKVTYEVETGRLLIFEGPSNINSDSNKAQNVKIVYTYGQKPEDVGPK